MGSVDCRARAGLAGGTHDDQGASRDNLRALVQAIRQTHPQLTSAGTEQDTAVALFFDPPPSRGPSGVDGGAAR